MSQLVLTLAVDNAAPGKAIGIKEAIAMDLEKYGDVRVLQKAGKGGGMSMKPILSIADMAHAILVSWETVTRWVSY